MEEVPHCHPFNHLISLSSNCTEDSGPSYLLHKGQMEYFSRLFLRILVFKLLLFPQIVMGILTEYKLCSPKVP